MKRGALVALLICASSQTATAMITMNPGTLDTGDVVLGQTGQAQGTMTSTQNEQLDLTIAACSGGGGTFMLDQSQDVDLKDPVVFTVTYAPTARGQRTCRVDVYDNMNNFEGSFFIRGNGVLQPTMQVSGNTDFTSVRWNDAAPVRTFSRNFTVTNAGDQALNLTGVALSGANPGDWAVTAGSLTPPIPGMGARTFTITFNPTTAGARAATLTFTNSNDPANPSDAFNLTGTGTNAVIGVTAPMGGFGVVNTGSSALLDITVRNNATAPVGPLGVTSATITDPNSSGWFSFTGSCSGMGCTFSPALSINTMTTVGIRCSPPMIAPAAQMQTATVTFNGDTDNATANAATVSCVAGKSDLATNLNTVMFTPQLVASTTSPTSVMITNTGNVAATFYLLKTGANQGAFTVSTPTMCGVTGTLNQCGIAAGGMATFDVTFTPGVEGDIAAGVTIIPSPGSPVQVTLSGRGIDRHIDLIESLQFPDTYRNPGDAATELAIPVKNLGEYPLTVTELLFEGNGNWELGQSLEGFMVPGLATVDVKVLFKPTTAGKAPDGTLVVRNNDPVPARQMLTVTVSGNGKDRNVRLGPGPLDFGNTGAGVPVNYNQLHDSEQWLFAHNMDEADFKIREIKSDMPDVFKIVTVDGDAIDNMDLPVMGTQKFDVVFQPSKPGDYNATIAIYLDMDPVGQRTVGVHGNALFVDARGGGGFGCSTGHGAGSGMLLALLALLRRKRRRA